MDASEAPARRKLDVALAGLRISRRRGWRAPGSTTRNWTMMLTRNATLSAVRISCPLIVRSRSLDIHKDDFDQRFGAGEEAFALGQFITARFEDLGQLAVLIPEAAMGVLDDDFALFHICPFIAKLCPEARLMWSTTENRSASAESLAQCVTTMLVGGRSLTLPGRGQ